MNNPIHFYQFRHLFKGDDYLGKYDTLTHIAHLAPEFDHLRQEVKSFFMNSHGILAKVLVGSEELKAVAPLQEFPDEIRALMTPQQGDTTPEVVAWARENFPAKEFNRRYDGRQPLQPETPEATGEPLTRDEMKAALRAVGIDFPGNAKNSELAAMLNGGQAAADSE